MPSLNLDAVTMTTKAYVFVNVPTVDDTQQYLTDYLEGTLETDVDQLELHPDIPDRVLVIFKDDCIDLVDTNKLLAVNPMEDSHLAAALAIQKNVIILDSRQYSHFEQYLESNIEGGKSIVSMSIAIPGSERVAVCFISREALDSILTQKAFAGDVKMQPFYHNFHGCIPYEGKLMSQIMEEAEKQLEEKRLTKSSKKPPKVMPKPKVFSKPNVPPRVPQKTEVPKDHELQKCSSNVWKANDLGHDQSQKQGKAHEKEEAKLEPECACLKIEEYYWALLQKKTKDLAGCSMDYDQHRQSLNIESIRLPECLRAFEDWKADIIEGSPLQISDNLKRVFKRCNDFFNSCRKEYFEKYNVQCVLKDDDVCFYGWNVEEIDKAKSEVQCRFMHRVEITNDSEFSMDELRNKKTDLESDLFIIVSWLDSKGKTILIEGVKDDVSMAENDIKTILEKYKTTANNFEFLSDYTSYVKEYCEGELKHMLDKVKVTFQGEKDGNYCIEYSGMKDNVNNVTKDLTKRMSSMKCEHINVSECFDKETSKLVTTALINIEQLDNVSGCQTNFKNEYKCCIVNDVPIETQKQERRSKRNAGVSPVQASTPTSQPSSQGLVIDVMAEGDIIKQAADILVCTLHETKQLKKLRISKAFLRPFPDLQSTIDDLDFSSCNVRLCKVLSSQMNCKFIAFILLHRWSTGSSESDIQEKISEVLVKANESGVHSVAFPPIGVGIALKYPPEIIGPQITAAIEAYQSSTSKLNKITILAGNAKLYQTLKRLDTSSKEQKGDQKSETDARSGEDSVDDVSTTSTVNIKIVHCQKQDLASLWTEKLKSFFVEDEYDLKSDNLPVRVEKAINNKSQSLAVIVKKSETPSGSVLLKFRGVKAQILELKDLLHHKMSERVHIISENSPPRGTVEFIKYAASIEERTPSYWKYKKQKDFEKKPYLEVEVDDETKNAIKSMFLSTWNAAKSGRGFDAKGISSNSQVEFINVVRVENLKKFKPYSNARKEILEKKAKEASLCQNIAEVSANKKGSELSPYIPDHMKDQLCHEINECYLLHGTRPEIVDTIKVNGCDPNVSSPHAMFGKGVYAAECSTKCDQYTDDPNNRLPSGSTHYAFLLRMLLGDIFLCDHTHPSTASKDCAKLMRAPCKDCLQDKCRCTTQSFYNSVMGEGKWIFREFVVYRDYMCYPEYLISYKRN